MSDNGNIATFTGTLMWKTYESQYVRTAGLLDWKLTLPIKYSYVLIGMISMMAFLVYTPNAANYIRSTASTVWETSKKIAMAVLHWLNGQASF